MKKKIITSVLLLSFIFLPSSALLAQSKIKKVIEAFGFVKELTDLLSGLDTKVDCASEYEISETQHVLLCSDCKTYALGQGTRWSECRP